MNFRELCCALFVLMLPISVTVAGTQDSKSIEDPKSISISDDAAELGFKVKKLEAIDKKYSSLLNRKKIAGVSVLVARKGQEVLYGQWGYEDREKGIPLDRNSIVRIYSMTKPITSVAVMQLVEQELSLIHI